MKYVDLGSPAFTLKGADGIDELALRDHAPSLLPPMSTTTLSRVHLHGPSR